MKRIIIFVPAVLLCFITAYAIQKSMRCTYCHSMRDRFSRVLFLGEDTTQFSVNYSEANFFRISQGMSKEDVVALLGEPFKKDRVAGANFVEVWRFSQAPPGNNYWFRIVLFNADGKVVSTEAKYFVD